MNKIYKKSMLKTMIFFALKKLSNERAIKSWYSGRAGHKNITAGSRKVK